MSTPVNFQGSYGLPPDNGLQPAPIPFNYAGVFNSEASAVLNLTGTGSKTVDLGTIALGTGALFLAIKVDPSQTATPITVKINGQVAGYEVSPGGFLLVANPVPVAGTTALVITYTSACIVRIWAVG